VALRSQSAGDRNLSSPSWSAASSSSRMNPASTSLNRDLARRWEPGAPAPQERLACLRYTAGHGWRTSVSIEPMLGGCDDALRTFREVEPLVTEKLWAGKMNYVRQYVDRDRRTPEIDAACNQFSLGSRSGHSAISSFPRNEPVGRTHLSAPGRARCR